MNGEVDTKKAAHWACGVLDAKRYNYDRRGWHDIARIGANKVLDLVARIEALEKRLDDAR